MQHLLAVKWTSKFISLGLVMTICGLFFFMAPEKAGAVTVGPVKLEYSLNPGDVVKGEIFLKNEETDGKTFYPSFERFTEQNGNKVFTKDENLLKDWFQTESSVTLNGGEDKKVPFVLTIPQNAPPGGQFGVLWWSTSPPNVTGVTQVSIQTRAGILVYVNISGNVVSSADITSFGASGGQKLFWGGTVPLSISISNTGNVYIKPTGTVKITSIFGMTKADVPINPKGYQILPKSYRDIGDMEWTPSRFNIGLYKAHAEMTFGEKGEKIDTSTWLWVFPMKTIGIILIIIIILILFFKGYNRMLLKKYKRNS